MELSPRKAIRSVPGQELPILEHLNKSKNSDRTSSNSSRSQFSSRGDVSRNGNGSQASRNSGRRSRDRSRDDIKHVSKNSSEFSRSSTHRSRSETSRCSRHRSSSESPRRRSRSSITNILMKNSSDESRDDSIESFGDFVLGGARQAISSCLEPEFDHELMHQRQQQVLDFSYITCYNITRRCKRKGWMWA